MSSSSSTLSQPVCQLPGTPLYQPLCTHCTLPKSRVNALGPGFHPGGGSAFAVVPRPTTAPVARMAMVASCAHVFRIRVIAGTLRQAVGRQENLDGYTEFR